MIRPYQAGLGRLHRLFWSGSACYQGLLCAPQGGTSARPSHSCSSANARHASSMRLYRL